MRRWMHAVGALLLVAVVATGAFAADAGTVVEIAGTVTIDRAGGLTPATVGTIVQVGDEIRTGEPGRARLVFLDDSVLTLADGSTLVVDESVVNVASGVWNSMFRLVTGKVRLLVSDHYGEAGSAFEVKTTTAVSGVRGTQFVVAYSPQRSVTEILGLEGSVRVHAVVDPSGRGVLVHAEEWTSVARGGRPTPPRKMGAAERRSFLEDLEQIGDGSGAVEREGEPDERIEKVPAESQQAGRRGATGKPGDVDQGGTVGQPGSLGELGATAPSGDVGATPGAAAGRGTGTGPPAFPGDASGLTPSDLLGQPAPVVRQKGGLGVEF